jgi:hypothetical protein
LNCYLFIQQYLLAIDYVVGKKKLFLSSESCIVVKENRPKITVSISS